MSRTNCKHLFELSLVSGQVVGYLPRPAAGARTAVDPLHGLWARGSGSCLVPGTVPVARPRSRPHQGSLIRIVKTNADWILIFLFAIILGATVPNVSDSERSGLSSRQPDRPQRPQAAERAGHGGWSSQVGRFRIGPHLRRAHGPHFSGKQMTLHVFWRNANCLVRFTRWWRYGTGHRKSCWRPVTPLQSTFGRADASLPNCSAGSRFSADSRKLTNFPKSSSMTWSTILIPIVRTKKKFYWKQCDWNAVDWRMARYFTALEHVC